MGHGLGREGASEDNQTITTEPLLALWAVLCEGAPHGLSCSGLCCAAPWPCAAQSRLHGHQLANSERGDEYARRTHVLAPAVGPALRGIGRAGRTASSRPSRGRGPSPPPPPVTYSLVPTADAYGCGMRPAEKCANGAPCSSSPAPSSKLAVLRGGRRQRVAITGCCCPLHLDSHWLREKGTGRGGAGRGTRWSRRTPPPPPSSTRR